MSSLEVHVYDDKTAVVSTTVEIDSLAQLSRLMEKLEASRTSTPSRAKLREHAPHIVVRTML